MMTTEIERLANLVQDEDENNHALCIVLLSAVEVHYWALHAQAKIEIKMCTQVRGGSDGFYSRT